MTIRQIQLGQTLTFKALHLGEYVLAIDPPILLDSGCYNVEIETGEEKDTVKITRVESL